MSTVTLVIIVLNALAAVGLAVAATLTFRRARANLKSWEEQERYWRERYEKAEKLWREEVEPYL